MKKCGGTAHNYNRYIAELSDRDLVWAVGEHANPDFWKRQQPNQHAFLRSYGSLLRREARRRGVL